MPKDKNDSRPLSPHIQIYKPQVTSITSIMHRITGIFSFIGLIAMCWFIVYNVYFASYSGGKPCDCIWLKLLHIVKHVIIAGFLFSLYYHICNGIRHLVWDCGKAFDIKTANKTGKIVIAISLLLTTANVIIFFI